MSELVKIQTDEIKIYNWAKDDNGKFTSCSENVAELQGADSPKQMLLANLTLIYYGGIELVIVRPRGSCCVKRMFYSKLPIANHCGGNDSNSCHEKSSIQS